MALQDPQAEPSMEEILASIRRIISEEEQAPAEPVLDLTEHAQAAPAPSAPAEDDIVFEAVEAAVEDVPPPRPAPHPPAQEAAAVTPETIISPPTASAAAGAMARLAGTARRRYARQTIEGVVRELLKPMLKEWLDHNRPLSSARLSLNASRAWALSRFADLQAPPRHWRGGFVCAGSQRAASAAIAVAPDSREARTAKHDEPTFNPKAAGAR